MDLSVGDVVFLNTQKKKKSQENDSVQVNAACRVTELI